MFEAMLTIIALLAGALVFVWLREDVKKHRRKVSNLQDKLYRLNGEKVRKQLG